MEVLRAMTILAWRRELAMVLFLVACGMISGCGQSLPRDPDVYPVHGQVTLDGEPVCASIITFRRDDLSSGGMGGRALSDADGNYEASAIPRKMGLVAGEYLVSVAPLDASEHNPFECGEQKPIPKKYQNFESSGLKVTVTNGDNSFDIPLTSDAGGEEADAAEE